MATISTLAETVRICHVYPSELVHQQLTAPRALYPKGGANPVHAELLAADIDEDTVLKYLDRYIMYYILTADRLERTAPWQSKLPGGKNGGGPIEHLKDVIIDDSLGICDELDRRMQHLVDTYHDEWVRRTHVFLDRFSSSSYQLSVHSFRRRLSKIPNVERSSNSLSTRTRTSERRI